MKTKYCRRCKQDLGVDLFHKSKSRSDGFSIWCKTCEREHRRDLYHKRKESLKENTAIEKVCKRCKENKPSSEYWRNYDRADGLSTWCISCEKTYRKEPHNKKSYLLTRIKGRAEKAGLDFNLELDDIVIPERCPILDIPIVWGNFSGKAHPTDNSPSVDRIVPQKGYVKGNIVVVSQRANRIKNDSTIEELRKICSFYELLQEDKGE